jgi:hypothetical protein
MLRIPADPARVNRDGSESSRGRRMVAVGTSYESSSATMVGGDQADNSAPESGAVYLY